MILLNYIPYSVFYNVDHFESRHARQRDGAVIVLVTIARHSGCTGHHHDGGRDQIEQS
jgi:hypothetical protein